MESNSEAVILPEGGLLDPAFGVNHDTSNSNDIAEHKDGNKSDRELVTTDSTTKYVIRFYVSNTGTKDSYTEQNKYGIPGQPNSTIDGAEGGDTVTIMVSPDYAILTQYTDVAKGISTEKFTAVNVTGDTDVRAWLNQYAENKVPDGLKKRDNVNAIVNFVNDQYNNSGKRLPTLDANKFNGFRFVDAHYVNSGECSIHVHVQLIKENQYIVHYDSNGGSGAMVDENLYFPGDQATVKANEFTRTGYTFAGWNTEEDGTGTSYNPNGDNNEVTIGTENVTLYAQWTPQTATTKTQAMYFVLLPNRGTPKNNADQGEANYLPSSKSDGGAKGRDESNGYDGYLTKAGKEALEAATSKSITNITNGVPKEYLSAPSDLGFFNPSNWKNGSYKDSSADISMLGENFNVNGIQIVWYTIKNQEDGIHVDGYVKNVAIDVTYHSNFDTDMTYTDATKTGTNYSVKDYTETGLLERSGYTFAGWYTEASCDNAYTGGVLMSNLHLYAKWTPKQYTYTVEYYYDGVKDASKTETGSAEFGSQVKNYTDKNTTGYTFAEVEGLPLTISATATSNVIKVYYTKTENPPAAAQYTVKHYKWDTQKKEYTLANTDVIDSTVGTVVTATARTYDGGYILNEQKSKQTKSGTVLEGNTLTLELYYDVDKIGEGEKLDQPDGIPDRYQVTINYVDDNTGRGRITGQTKEVLTIKNTAGEWASTGTVTASGSTATVTGSSRNYFSNWTKDNRQVSTNATLNNEAIQNVIKEFTGGKTYTFIANFGRSRTMVL